MVKVILLRKYKKDCDVCRRDPKSLVKPAKMKDENDENKCNEQLEAKTSKAVRHILLIRHGQYYTDGKTDAARVLTELGTVPAELSV